MNAKRWLIFSMLINMTLISSAQLYAEPITAAQWRERIIHVYQSLDRYTVNKSIAITTSDKNGAQSTHFTVNVAIDRTNQSIAILSDDLKLTGSQKSVQVQLIPSCNAHLRLNNVNPLDPPTLQQAWPTFPLWLWMPDLALYLNNNVDFFLNKSSFQISPKTDLPNGQMEFVTRIGQNHVYLTLDTSTNLFCKVRINDSSNSHSDTNPRTQYVIELKYSLPETWPIDTFALDTQNSKPVPSFEKLIQKSKDSSQLAGKPAPDIVLDDFTGKAFDLAKAQTKVVFLDFWATWCGPCRKAMPETVELDRWIKANKLNAAVYTINQRENKDQIQKYIKENNLQLPVLMDTSGIVSSNYGANSIPQTVIIADGIIKQIYTGYTPGLAQKWRTAIQEALNQPIE